MSPLAPGKNAVCCNQRQWATLDTPSAGTGKLMRIRQEKQINPVGDEVLSLVAVVQPILLGVLYALKADIVKTVGGYDNVPLKLLSRLYKPGDGDCGICFEYAVHDAMNRNDDQVLDRVSTAIKLCKVKGHKTRSILFGAEKKRHFAIDRHREGNSYGGFKSSLWNPR